MRRLRILTWHVHGNYLWYLSHAHHDFYLPVKTDNSPGYGGRGATFPFGDNVHDLPAEEVRRTSFDCILYQHADHYLNDQYELLTPAQRRLPRIFIQHDPPLDHPTDQRHWCDDQQVRELSRDRTVRHVPREDYQGHGKRQPDGLVGMGAVL